MSARAFEVYSRDGELGSWVKQDPAAMARDYPSIFLPTRR